VTRFSPRGLLGQLAALILAAFIAAQLISVWLFTDERGAAIRAAQRLETVERAAAVAHALEAAPAAGRESILAAANSRLVRFSLDDAPLVENGQAEGDGIEGPLIELLDGDHDLRAVEVAISRHDGRRAEPPAPLRGLHHRMSMAGLAPVELRLSVPLLDGSWLNVMARFQRPDLQVPPAILGTTLLSLVLIMAALWLGLSRITRPLRRLAAVADGVGLDGPPPDMPQGGPREVRALSEALARMHERLTGLVADRTRMLAALGHDLRSPITALRVRAEMVEDEETRERMVAALDEMQDMVEATLAYARGVSGDQPSEATDLADLLEDLVLELSETGPQIRLVAKKPVVAQVRRTAMRRALRNLLENAQRYGGGASVTMQESNGALEIVIDDDGPGIPAEHLERVFDPFTRLETSRSRETGGIGLGLPIARAILRAHGGDVSLGGRPDGGGLRVIVTVPRSSDSMDSAEAVLQR
jgi:signal transduction histidine kinase